MIPGVWIATQASNETNAKIYAAADGERKLPNTAQILVEHRKNNAILQLRADLQGQSSLSASYRAHPNLSLFATSLMNGNAWVGGHFDRTLPLAKHSLPSQLSENLPIQKEDQPRNYTGKQYEGLDTLSRDVVNVKFGAWMPVVVGEPGNRPDVGQGYAAANLLGATFASAFSSNGTSFDLKTYFSANLNDTDRPPLQVTLDRDSKKASIGLTQVLAFDRVQLNLFDDRAPFVRNTLAWTIRLESLKNSSPDRPSNTGSEERTNRVLLGAAWQLNRSLSVKTVFDGSDVSTAFMFKRWKHPRIFCSVLNKWSLKGAPSFLGLGIELETGGVEEHPNAYYYAHHPEPPMVVDHDEVPQTKVVLPGNLEQTV